MYKFLLSKNKIIISMLLIISIVFTACDKTQKSQSGSGNTANTIISKTKSNTTAKNTSTTAVTPKVSVTTTKSTAKSSSKSTTKNSVVSTNASSVSTKTSTASLEKSESTAPPPTSQYSAYNLCNSSQEVVYMILDKIYNNYVGFTISVPDPSFILSSQDYINMMPGLKSISLSYIASYPEYGVTYYYVNLDVNDYVPYAYAVKTGDYSFLNANETAALNKAKQIASNYSSLGSDYEKELAVHNYLEQNIVYTNGSGNVFNEYGALIDGRCVCDGYAKAFDLLMLLLGIDCYRVTGTADGGNHAWNKVKLGGQWYNVDVTWDDSSGSYCYLNLTDSMLDNDHQWDGSTWPSASTTSFTYYYLNSNSITQNQSEFDSLIDHGLDKKMKSFCLIYEEAQPVDCKKAISSYNSQKGANIISYSDSNISNTGGYFNIYIYTDITYNQ